MTTANPAGIAAQAIAKAKADPVAAAVAGMAKVPADSAPAHGKYSPGVVKRPNAYFIDPDTVRIVDGWNVRFEFGEIELLAASIRTELERDPATGGLINDLRVRRLPKPEGKYVFDLVSGQRRLTAIRMLQKKGVAFPDGVPAKIETASADDLALLIRDFSSNNSKPLLPLEKADAFNRMKKAGMTLKDIEKSTGCSDNDIVGCLALLDADESVREAVKSGKVSGGTAKAIAVNARGDKAKQAELTKAAAAAAAGKDKKAMKAVKVAIDDERRKKAAKKGLKLKMRALTDDQLKSIGEKMAEVLVARLAALGLNPETDMTEWMSGADGDVKAAFSYGVLQGLKAAAGVPVDMLME